MGKKTSVYFPDDLAEAVAESGAGVAELVRRGLDAPALDPAMRAATYAVDAVREDLREIVRSEVRKALSDAQGGY